MRSAPGSRSAAGDPDRTARARIRDAAIELFGRDGFDASVRAIAAEAGVSPGLVLHHFGSKDGLREACDAHVREEIRRSKTVAVTDAQPGGLLNELAQVDEYVPLLAYIVRSLQSGGPLARGFVEHMVEDAQQYMRQGEVAGTVKPSRDSAARDRYLVLQSIGLVLLMAMEQTADGSPLDARRLMDDALHISALPALELFTQGLLTSGEMLETYLRYVSAPPPQSDGGDASSPPDEPYDPRT